MQGEFFPSIGPTCDDTTTCGTSLQPTQANGKSMSYAEASRASTSQAVGKKTESTENILDCGNNSRESFAIFDRNSSSWRMSETLFTGDLATYSETWPDSGLMLNGTCFRLLPLVPRNAVKGCSLLPTLTASDAKGARNGTAKGRSVKDGLTMTDWLWLNVGRGMLDPGSAEQMMGFPTGWTDLEDSETPSSPK